MPTTAPVPSPAGRRGLAVLCGLAALLVALLLLGCGADPGASNGEPPLIGLVTKTEDNPFFVRLTEAARERADALGLQLRAYSGRYDGDSESQIQAIGELLEAGARAILITPSEPGALSAAVARARAAGVLVIALDTPFDPPDAVDATFATDNFRAGQLIGRWARGRLGPLAARTRLATLDHTPAQVTVDVMRNQGFLHGFGIDIQDPMRMYDEDDPRIRGGAPTSGSTPGGRSAMARLIRRDPSIRLVYAINEPAAAGAYAALAEAGLEQRVLIVTIDGSCDGVAQVAAGQLAATAMQFPDRMARLAVDAVLEFVHSGRRPPAPAEPGFVDTGATLVTQQPVPGLPSIDAAEARQLCW